MRSWPTIQPGDTLLVWLAGTPPPHMSDTQATHLIVNDAGSMHVTAGGYTFELEDITPTARPGVWKAK